MEIAIGKKVGLQVFANDPAKKQAPFTVEVEVIDERPSFGRTDYLISPVSGTGELWVQAHRLVPLG
jgi:hypothetical protein